MGEGIEALNGRWDSVTRVLGPIDLHYHFRSRPLFRYLAKAHADDGAPKVLEFGCGAGDNLFALAKLKPGMSGVGIDIDQPSIHAAQRRAALNRVSGLRFECAETAEPVAAEAGTFDYALLIDVLEHLDNPAALLSEVDKLVKPGGRLLISVPTHRYPRVFGRKFHEQVGHVRDGFSLAELDELLGPSHTRIESNYNTGLVAGAACACFYRAVPKIGIRKIAILGMIGLHFSRLLDFFNGPSMSCSLWAVYERRG